MRPRASSIIAIPSLTARSSGSDALIAGARVSVVSPAASGSAVVAIRRVGDFVSLTKPRVVLMILVTTAVAFHLGSVGRPDWLQMLHALAATALAAGGTLALNQYLERDRDALMRRTQDRPIPSGRLGPREALVFGTIMTAVGLGYLAVAGGPLAGAVTLLTAVLYLGAYTPLKRWTPLCTIIGGIPGALPPVTGWAAARGELGLGALVMFAILFCWQIPHTLAIARLYREDYARAGIRVLPVVDPEGRSTDRLIVVGCLTLWLIALAPSLLAITGRAYLVGALLLGAAFMVCGAVHALKPSRLSARWVVLGSIMYLPLLLTLMLLDQVR